jgi:hypothetical protein
MLSRGIRNCELHSRELRHNVDGSGSDGSIMSPAQLDHSPQSIRHQSLAGASVSRARWSLSVDHDLDECSSLVQIMKWRISGGKLQEYDLSTST